MAQKNLILFFLLMSFLTLNISYESQAINEKNISGLLEESAFSIPVFPGTKLFEPSKSTVTISPPFATMTFILQTEKGKSLDAVKVVDFYKSTFVNKGWKESEGLKSNSNEPHLTLQCRFYNPETGQNLTGQFQLYISSKDGVIILCLRQWRNSYAGQKAQYMFAYLKSQLNEIEREINLKYNSTGRLARWEQFFEDENFLEGVYYDWITEEKVSDIVESIIAVYADERAAQKAQKNFISKNKLVESKGNVLIIVSSYQDRATESTRKAKEFILEKLLYFINLK